MPTFINPIRKQLERIGSDLVVSKVRGKPAFCEVTYAGNLSGLYDAERLLNVLTQLRAPDAGEDQNADVCATLAQIGFETEEDPTHLYIPDKAQTTA